MPDNFGTTVVPWSPAQALQMNEVCDRFEAAWKATPRGEAGPRIEEYLAGVPALDFALLLRDLVLLEIDYRRLRHERPTALKYEARFPSLSRQFLDEAFSEPACAPPPALAAEALAAREPGEKEDAAPMFQETAVLPPPFKPQLRSQRYVIRQFHAKGGIGEVWLADDAEIGRQVALKRLRKQREDQQDRFLMEAQITGQLEHPGIVPVHDLGVDEEGRPFYVMSFIHGRTLKEVIEEFHAGGPTSGEPRAICPPEPFLKTDG